MSRYPVLFCVFLILCSCVSNQGQRINLEIENLEKSQPGSSLVNVIQRDQSIAFLKGLNGKMPDSPELISALAHKTSRGDFMISFKWIGYSDGMMLEFSSPKFSQFNFSNDALRVAKSTQEKVIIFGDCTLIDSVGFNEIENSPVNVRVKGGSRWVKIEAPIKDK